MQVANAIRCDVCSVLMEGFVRKGHSTGASFDTDRVLDIMDQEYVVTSDDMFEATQQSMRVLQNKRGCNKHFKDELMAFGWRVLLFQYLRNKDSSLPK